MNKLDRDVLEPIAIISYALEYPQDADSPEGFWKVLTEKRNLMTKWPKDRLNLDAFYHRDGRQDQQVRSPQVERYQRFLRTSEIKR